MIEIGQKTHSFEDYREGFVQGIPFYSVQRAGKWSKRNFALHESEVRKHLDKQLIVASLAQWYPSFSALDLDHVTEKQIEDLRADLCLDDGNSILFTSPSADSFHLYFRPEYREKPPTIALLQKAIKPYCKAHGVEIYPQKRKAFRLPLGKGQDAIDTLTWEKLMRSWEDNLYWLKKLDGFDLAEATGHQLFFNFQPREAVLKPELKANCDISSIIENGLQGYSTRDFIQFEIIKHLWRRNLSPEDAWAFIIRWLAQHHNGFSKDWLIHPGRVKEHVKHQVRAYYQHMQFALTLPDQTHKRHKGYICRDDILEIITLAEGRLPRIRFIFELVKFMNPRRYRQSVPIHRDRLVDWSSHATYQGHLQYLEEKRIVKRGTGYLVGQKSKGISLTWNYHSDHNAVLFDGRTVQSLEQAVKMLFTQAEFRELLRVYGTKQSAQWATNRLFLG